MENSYTLYNRNYLCIVDYHSQFLVVKQVEGFSTENLMKTCKIIFWECGLPSKTVSDVQTLFQSNFKSSAVNLAYITQYCGHTTIKMGQQKHA